MFPALESHLLDTNQQRPADKVTIDVFTVVIVELTFISPSSEHSTYYEQHHRILARLV